MRRRGGVKGAGSYEITKEGLRALAETLPPLPDKENHRGCLVIKSNAREFHHFKPSFYVRTPFEKRFDWDRTSKPPNDFYYWSDGYAFTHNGEVIDVPRMRFIDAKNPDKKRLTLYLDPIPVTETRTYEDALQLLLERSYIIAAHIQREYGCQLSLAELPEAPHYVLNTDPEVAATLIAAGIHTDHVKADASDRIGQPHVETTSLEYALLDTFAPHHIKYLYEKGRQTQVAVFRQGAKLSEIEQHHGHLIGALLEYVETIVKNVDRIADVKLKEQLETEKVLEVINHIRNGKKDEPVDTGGMFL